MLEKFEQGERGGPVPVQQGEEGVLDLTFASLVAAPVRRGMMPHRAVQVQGQLGAALVVGRTDELPLSGQVQQVAVQDGGE